MKRLISIVCICLTVVGCSRSQTIISAYQGNGFYFTTENGNLYDYSGSLSKISNGRINSANISKPNLLHTSTQSSVNIISSVGKIVFRHEPGKEVVSSVLNRDMTYVIYAAKSGDIYKYNRDTNQTESLGIKLYPIPRQMILDEINEMIYYHDKSLVYRLDLNTSEVTVLTKVFFPIQSIAHNSYTNEIYFSTSTDGKIYKVGQYIHTIFLVHEPISARGSTISIDSRCENLFFSKSNGRDIQIKSLNLITHDIEDVITLHNINYIDNLMVKD